MTADYLAGWKAACAYVAAGLRNAAPAYGRLDPITGELLCDLADEIEKVAPPKETA